MSFRLGGMDGVSVEAAKWAGVLAQLGFVTRTVAVPPIGWPRAFLTDSVYVPENAWAAV